MVYSRPPVVYKGQYFLTKTLPTETHCKAYTAPPYDGHYITALAHGTFIGPVEEYVHYQKTLAVLINGWWITVWKDGRHFAWAVPRAEVYTWVRKGWTVPRAGERPSKRANTECPCADCLAGVPPRTTAVGMSEEHVMELHARYLSGTLYQEED